MTIATSTITVTHDGVFVTTSGRIKIAATHTKHWRIWIYNDTTDTWKLQHEIFKRREDAEAATKLMEAN
jgi:hypothetical protein